MPLVNIEPSTKEVEDKLAARIEEIRKWMKDTICEVSGFPRHDVLVNLLRCNARDADPEGADFVVFADTNPNETLEGRANDLCRAIAKVFVDLGLANHLTIEIWPRFLPGPWCLLEKNQITDMVFHPGSS
jgi:hypothetical protein